MKSLMTFFLLLASPAFAVDWSDPRAVAAAAIENNPTLLRLQSETEAARERIAPASAQPNPMLMTGIENQEIDLSDDEMMTMYVVGAQQTFVDPARRRARRTIAELEVRVLESSVAAARASIERDALLAWYDAAAADSQIVAAERVRALIDAIIGAARVRYEVGDAIQADVIRAQLEKSNLEHQILTLRGSRDAAMARLLALLGLPPATDVPRIHLPHEASRASIDRADAAPADHPLLASLEAEVERQNEIVRLAELQRRPDVGVEASYGHRRTQTDMFTVMASIELPLRSRTTIDPQIREAIASRDALRWRIEETRRDINAGLAVAAAVWRQATEQLRLHEDVLVPQAKLAFESTLGSYQTGRTSFDAVLAAETEYLRLQLEYFDFLAQQRKALADYEAIRKGATSAASSIGVMR